MRNQLMRNAITFGAAAMLAVGSAAAQTPAGQTAAAGDSVIVVEKPTYVTIPLEIDVNGSAADVWKRIGKYCDIAEWLQIPAGCKILSGQDNTVGAVRSVANEVLVGMTQYSYTYTQAVRAGRPYNLYHGTLEVRPVTATT